MALDSVISWGGRWGEEEMMMDIPHRLYRVGKDDLPVGVSFLVVVPAMMDELHLLEHRRLQRRVHER